jgi:cyclin E
VRRVLGANSGNFRNDVSDEMSSPTLNAGQVTVSSPLPFLEWADREQVWQLMTLKDESYRREPLLLNRHPVLQARMRTILLDWLCEVSDVYKLHRETFYLAIDFVDRFLTAESDVPKQELQLIGITCLFIAAKIEEIYPPKLSEFSYVTDGACNDSDILDKELVVLKALNWDLTPMTVNAWLSVYLQLYAGLQQENQQTDLISSSTTVTATTCVSDVRDFMLPGYASHFFDQVSELLDLCVLDIGSLSFNYSVLAAAALYHFTSEDKVYQCTGLRMNQIRECVIWMTSAAKLLREHGFEEAKAIRIKQ